MCQGWAYQLSGKQAKPIEMGGEDRSRGEHGTFCNFLCCTKVVPSDASTVYTATTVSISPAAWAFSKNLDEVAGG